MSEKDIVSDALKAIENYSSMLKTGKNPLGSGGKADDQGKKRKAMGIEISTFKQWEEAEKSTLEVIPTEIPGIDKASGVGGMPKGKMIELFGTESGGKSYIAYRTIASCQKMGGVAALLDVENAFTGEWARTVGIDTDALLYKNQPMSAEYWLQLAYDLCTGGCVDLIVIDSTAALIPQAMLDGVVGDQDMAVLARALTPGVSKLSMVAPFRGKGGKQTCVIWINQIREKPGTMFGSPETTPGGRALKFYSHMRIDVRKGKIERVKKGEIEEPIFQTSYGTIVKNKLSIPGRKFEFRISFDSNFTNPLVMLAKSGYEKKIFKKRQGLLRYHPVGEKEEIRETGAKDSVELARWIHSNNLVNEVVERVTNAYLEDKEDKPEFLSLIDENVAPPLPIKEGETQEETSESSNEKDEE